MASPDRNVPLERSRRSRLALGLVAAGLTVGGVVLFFGTKLLRNR